MCGILIFPCHLKCFLNAAYKSKLLFICTSFRAWPEIFIYYLFAHCLAHYLFVFCGHDLHKFYACPYLLLSTSKRFEHFNFELTFLQYL